MQATQHSEVMEILSQVLDAVQSVPPAAAAAAAIRPVTSVSVSPGRVNMSKELQKQLKAKLAEKIIGSTFCETPTDNPLTFPCFPKPKASQP